MGWLFAVLGYLLVLVLACRWWHELGIAKGRLLERCEVREAGREERRLAIVPRPPEDAA